MILFKSRLYREEFYRWLLIAALISWAITSTIWALSKTQKTVLIGIDENGTRLITDNKDLLLKSESLKMIQEFLKLYLNFDQNTHKENIGRAADLMASSLWEQQKGKLFEIGEKLKREPLLQTSETESIDLVGENTFEVIANIKILNRAVESKARIKMVLVLQKHERSNVNPWAFEIKELRDETL